ncbi:hypothetical protein PIB30_060154, partial [Stylosanthes scabra]|nr:hypothetical protein [Stylosanthes scabra]
MDGHYSPPSSALTTLDQGVDTNPRPLSMQPCKTSKSIIILHLGLRNNNGTPSFLQLCTNTLHCTISTHRLPLPNLSLNPSSSSSPEVSPSSISIVHRCRSSPALNHSLPLRPSHTLSSSPESLDVTASLVTPRRRVSLLPLFLALLLMVVLTRLLTPHAALCFWFVA